MVKRPTITAAHLRAGGFLPASARVTEINLEDDDVSILRRDWTIDGLVKNVRINAFQTKPALIVPAARFIHKRGKEKEDGTVYKFIKYLRTLDKFIGAYEQSYGIEINEYGDFTNTLVKIFKKWMEGKSDVRPSVNEKGSLSGLTIAGTYNFIRDLLLWVKENDGVEEIGEISFESNVAPGSSADIVPYRSLSKEETAKIRMACINELKVIFAKLAEGRRIVADEVIVVPHLGSSSPAFKRFEVCLKAYYTVEQMGLTYTQLKKSYPGLARAVRGQPYHSLEKLLPYLHFTRRTLIPVIIMLGMHTSFEPDTLIRLKADGIGDSIMFGSKRIKITGEKRRGGRRKKSKTHARNDKNPFSPSVLIDELLTTTARTAKRIGPTCKALFSYARRTGDFGHFKSSSSCAESLLEFIQQNKLKRFSLVNLRKSGADRAGNISGGDLAVQKEAMLHDSLSTTAKSYQNDANRARRAETLAHSQNVRARRVRTDSKIETRGRALGKDQRLAATPGFLCVDPYDSPLKGEVKGRLCTAYGRCPNCPLAMVDPGSSTDFFRLKQLGAELRRARTEMDPSRWMLHWAHVLDALVTDHLPRFSAEIAEQAAGLSLPPIPRIE